jgi:energy-coupling factor transporter ATP-binding protein EcfA2
MCDLFKFVETEVGEALARYQIVSSNNDLFGDFVGPFFITLHICINSQLVLAGTLSLGSFLASIAIYTQLSSVYTQMYKSFIRMSASFGALRNVTECFNMPLDMHQRKAINRSRRKRFAEARESIVKTAGCRRSDLVKISIKNLSWSHGHLQIFDNVSLEIPQGKIIGICGAHHSGKTTLMKLLGGNLLAKDADQVFIPSHLRALHVSDAALLGLSPWRDLTFGFPDAHPARVKSMLLSFKMYQTLAIVTEDLRELGLLSKMDVDDVQDLGENFLPGYEDHGVEHIAPDFPEGGKENWHDALSGSEKLKFSLVRALIMNPEVLLLRRPFSPFTKEMKDTVLSLFKEHVTNCGIGLPTATLQFRRPRTLFFSSASAFDEEFKCTDFILEVDPVSRGVNHRFWGDQNQVSRFQSAKRVAAPDRMRHSTNLKRQMTE